MMRSGTIESEAAQEHLDRRAEVLSLWERGTGGTIELPWSEAKSLDAAQINALVGRADSVVLAVGATASSRKLLDAVLQGVAAPCRLYIYADRALEADAEFVRKINTMGDRVLARLGHRPPADWVVVDGGRDGRLAMGPTADHRRWVVPVDGPLARTLFDAFRLLFWFHSVREALPDRRGEVAFRSPLAAPYPSPGQDVSLPSGRIRLNGVADDPVPDAEFRISARAVDPGPARVLFVPPTDGHVTGAAPGPVMTDLPTSLCGRGHRVVWVDTGLPRMTLTKQRMVVDLVEAPIALQLEWPRAAAIDLYHRFERAAQAPAWEFHATRRLGDVRGDVLLQGATQPAALIPAVSLDAGDVVAPLPDFDSARPAHFPDVPLLALEATFRWRRVPAALPPGARSAEMVRQWTAVDEWTSRRVDTLRAVLDELEKQDGLLGKFRRWLSARSESTLERRQIRHDIDDIGESRPSERPENASEHVRRLVAIAVRLDELRGTTHQELQAAQDAEAEERQRSAWESRVRDAQAKLEEVRHEVAQNEEAQRQALANQEAAQAVFDELVASRREERATSLAEACVALEEEQAAARAFLKSLDPDRKGKPNKAARNEANERVYRAVKAVRANKHDRESIESWTPPAIELGEAGVLLDEANHAVAARRAEAKRLSKDVQESERDAAVEFRFERPTRLVAPSTMPTSAPPPIPPEAPPELGDLYEHHGKRFLAIRTWEQLKPAVPVATRLRAELVVAATTSKK